ncbi:MAG: polysaccharide biosynthesis C-terminal domain-containing protein [Bacteroidales bacterium]|nr:polysaccharide biosynthesis C-terminal domain-containing protein [Bacteroidales bacterium]
MLRNIVFTVFTRFFIAASSLAVAILISNYLGASGRGEQSLIITSVSFIIVITSVIGTSSISYLLPRHPFSVLIIPSYIWVVLIILLCVVMLPFMDIAPQEYITDVCVLSLMLSVTNINLTVLISRQRINAANFLNFIQSFLTILILVLSFILFHNLGIEAYLFALYIGYGTALLVSFIFIKNDFAGFRHEPLNAWKEAMKKLATLGVYNQIAAFTQIMNLRLSYYILNAYFGTEEVGIYSNAVSIAESIWLIGRSIATVQHSRIVNSRDTNFSLTLTSQMNKLNLAVSTALIVILVCIPESWYMFLFGDEFTNINRIIRTLGPGILFFGIFLILGYYFSSTGRPYVNAVANIGGLIITLVFGFILIPAYDCYGAGITASLSYGVMALIVMIFYFCEKRKIHTASSVHRSSDLSSPDFSGNDPAIV